MSPRAKIKVVLSWVLGGGPGGICFPVLFYQPSSWPAESCPGLAALPHVACCHATLLLKHGICISFLSGRCDRSSLEKKGFVYAHASRVQSVLCPGKALWQECEAAGHMASMVRKQNADPQLHFSLCKVFLTLFMCVHMCAPHEFVCKV